MKKIYIFLLTLVLTVAGVSVFGEVITTRKISPAKNSNPASAQTNNQTGRVITVRQNSKLSDSVKMCKPYSETLDTSMSGIDFNFKVKIAGWVNNKCRIDFVAQSTGINDMFKSLYGVDSSQATIKTFEPKVRCDFTKQQLQYVGDSILQEEERNSGSGGKMLKNPSDIQLPTFASMSESDSKLMNVVLNDRACTILNAQDSSEMFESLFSF
jgi:hypothetical protein